MSALRQSRFAVYIAMLVLGLGAAQLIASVLFYQSIDRQTLLDDHARRIAELLVVSERLHSMTPEQTSTMMNTRYLSASVTAAPQVTNPRMKGELATIAEKIVHWEPVLADRALRLERVPNINGRDDLVGSIQMPGNGWLNFRSVDISSMWSVAWRAIVLTLVSTAALMGMGLLLLHRLSRPLRRLTDAAAAIGHGKPISIEEGGPKDLGSLAHAMNLMQARIAALLKEQAQSFEAISHDLRTPLARQKVAAELLDDRELSDIVIANVDEMEDLLASLQQFLRAQHLSSKPETTDLCAFIYDAIAPFEDRVAFHAAGELPVETFVEPLRISIAALIENALQYGDHAQITLDRDGTDDWTISIEDAGPGIPSEHFQEILDPFFRLDEARARDTRGFGLGIPTAHRLMTRFNGGLSFAISGSGSLIARLKVPKP